MYGIVLWAMAAMGAAIGAFSAIGDGAGTMIVMGLIGAGFGCPLGAGLCLLPRLLKKKGPGNSRVVANGDIDEESGLDPYMQMKMAKQWMDERERFPFHIAGDPDPEAKLMTGSKDLADIARNRDIHS